MKKKVLLTLICALALVIGSVFGTMAYLTDTESVQNTFTVGKVNITLDEADTDKATDTNPDDITTGAGTDAQRDKANVYHLIPGETYPKDPIIHVSADSEDCYLFVTVANGLAEIIDGTGDIEDIGEQMTRLGWDEVPGYTGVYYLADAQGNAIIENAGENRVVFESFTVKGAEVGNSELGGIVPNGGKDLNNYKTANITVTAYAVQEAGFDSAADAWGATFGD